MFEKNGIKYAIEQTVGTECLSMPIEDYHFIDLSEAQQEKAQCFKDGAEFGYNKANEWQFLKTKDDLPKPRDTRRVLTWYGRNIKEGKPVILDANRFDVGGAVIAWKEIVLLKESE